MTFLTVLAWTGGIILVLVAVLLIALCVYLGHAVVQERRLSRLEAEAVESELSVPRPQFTPYVPSRQPSDDALSHPAPNKPAP